MSKLVATFIAIAGIVYVLAGVGSVGDAQRAAVIEGCKRETACILSSDLSAEGRAMALLEARRLAKQES